MSLRSMTWKTFPLWVGIAGALAALGFVLMSELRVQNTRTILPPSRVDGDLILTGFRLSTLLDGEREWEISASRARLFEQDHQALLDTVRGTVRTDDGSVVEFEGRACDHPRHRGPHPPRDPRTSSRPCGEMPSRSSGLRRASAGRGSTWP